MRKTHECHSEPQAKNLALPAIYQTEILRLSPQDDTEIPDDAGGKRFGFNYLNGLNGWNGLNSRYVMLI